ncbi:MAG: hypothetical protein II727_05710, partial [Oscillospiraceae bacterium]|nr:hypothetical protein [Oscillospiraceae bacterium]
MTIPSVTRSAPSSFPTGGTSGSGKDREAASGFPRCEAPIRAVVPPQRICAPGSTKKRESTALSAQGSEGGPKRMQTDFFFASISVQIFVFRFEKLGDKDVVLLGKLVILA